MLIKRFWTKKFGFKCFEFGEVDEVWNFDCFDLAYVTILVFNLKFLHTHIINSFLAAGKSKIVANRAGPVIGSVIIIETRWCAFKRCGFKQKQGQEARRHVQRGLVSFYDSKSFIDDLKRNHWRRYEEC